MRHKELAESRVMSIVSNIRAPRVGVISPTMANIALHGIEE